MCAVSGCGSAATGQHTWGMYPDGARNQSPLCPGCAAGLWDQIKGPVSAGLMHYEVRPVPVAPNGGQS